MRNKWIYSLFKSCQLCPRSCGIDRFKNRGFCGEYADLKIAAIVPHLGEEPPISGKNGSGTIFFTGCSLKCKYCQNFQISHQSLGKVVTPNVVVEKIKKMYLEKNIHNVNFVTPDHFIPYTFEIIDIMRKKYILLPVVFNFSGYQKCDVIDWLYDYADIYLPDFKYADNRLGKFLSNCDDYSTVAIEAICRMVKQKGFLDFFRNDKKEIIAKKGVLVRHLILPGFIENSLNVLTTLFIEFGKELPISIMSQFYPTSFCKTESLNRRITEGEFREVFEYAKSLGFQNLFVQYPDKTMNKPEFLPDFTKDDPFSKN